MWRQHATAVEGGDIYILPNEIGDKTKQKNTFINTMYWMGGRSKTLIEGYILG
jgi:hypothetical protein